MHVNPDCDVTGLRERQSVPQLNREKKAYIQVLNHLTLSITYTNKTSSPKAKHREANKE